MSRPENVPDGFAYNTPEQSRILREALTAAWRGMPGEIEAFALVIAMPGGTITAGMAAMPGKPEAFAVLIHGAPEVLKQAIRRAEAGHGSRVVVTADGEEDI